MPKVTTQTVRLRAIAAELARQLAKLEAEIERLEGGATATATKAPPKRKAAKRTTAKKAKPRRVKASAKSKRQAKPRAR